MSLTVTEANHVAHLLGWLSGVTWRDGHGPNWSEPITDAEAIEAMELLADHAGRTLQMSPDRELPARIVERLRAADSDGAAQAVCRALDQQFRGVVLPRAVALPADLRRTLETWRRLQDTELGERLRDQTAGSIDTAGGTVDV